MIKELKFIKENYDTELSNISSDFISLVKGAFFSDGIFPVILFIFFVLLITVCTLYPIRTFFGESYLKRKLSKIKDKIDNIDDILNNSILESSISVRGNVKTITKEKFDSLNNKKSRLLNDKELLNRKKNNIARNYDETMGVLSACFSIVGIIFFLLGIFCFGNSPKEEIFLKEYELQSMKAYENFVETYPANEMDVLRLRKTGTNEYQLIYINGAGIISEISYTGKLEVTDSLDKVIYEFKYLPLKEDYKGTLLEEKELNYGRYEEVVKIGKPFAYVLDGKSEYISDDIK